MAQVLEPFPLFFDDDGTPLENGKIYIGEINQNPITNPVTVYTDEGLAVSVGQPIRTLAGRPAYQGSAVNLFVSGEAYSILVQDKNGAPVVGPSNIENSPAVVNVKDFGAVGDGATDDTAAFTAALAASGHVIAPPGTYLVSTIDFNDDNRSLFGYGATLKANSSAPIIRSLLANRTVASKSLENVKIRGFVLDGDSTAVNCAVLERFTRQCEITDCQIRNATGNGIDISESWSFQFIGNRISNNGGRGLYFHATNTADTDGLNAFEMTGNWSSLNGGVGMYIENVQAGFISGNTSEYNGDTNIVLAGSQLDVTGNYFEGFSTARSDLGGSAPCVILGTSNLAFSNSVFNNYVNGGSVGASSFDGDGIALVNVRESYVRGMFSLSTRYSYTLAETDTFVGNDIFTSSDAPNAATQAATIRNTTTGTTGGLEVIKGANVYANRSVRTGDGTGIRQELQIEPNGTTGSLYQSRVIENGAVAFQQGKLSSTEQRYDFTGAAGSTYRYLLPLAFSSELLLSPSTPSQLTTNANNYTLSSLPFQRLSSDASRTISGFEAENDGSIKVLANVGGNDIVIAHESGSSDAANRVVTSTGANVTLGANKLAILIYDGTASRWRAVVLP